MLKYIICATVISLNLGCELEVSRKKHPNTTQTNGDNNTRANSDNDQEGTPPGQVSGAIRTTKYILTGLDYDHYQAEISWSPGLANISIYLNGISVFSQQDLKTTSYILDLKSDTNYSIKVYTINDDSHSTLATKEKSLIGTWELRTPLDLLLNQTKLDTFFNKTGDKVLFAHRIFLAKDTEIFTYGNGLSLNTDELFADRSEISSFPLNLKAATNTNGRSGGNIFIKAKRAQGRLTINQRGEHGGDGIDGTPYLERAAQGAQGENGHCERVDTPRHTYLTCDKRPASGAKGARGGDAHPGSNGGSGGNTGLAKIEITEDSSNFLVNVIKTEGLAGIPGRASQPQLGGLAGRPGHTEGDGDCCRTPEPITLGEGDPGSPAADGTPQSNGLIQTECVLIGVDRAGNSCQ